jgi:hypothetical protein
MNIPEFARKPYPQSHNRWAIVLIISVFVSLFMVIFQPFGLQQLETAHKILLLAGYGLVTFLVLLLDLILLPLIFPGIFNEDRWTVLDEALFLTWIVLTIAAGNYLYSVLVSIGAWVGVQGFFIFTGFTLAIAILPIIGIIVISHNRLLKQNLAAAQEINRMIEGKIADRKSSTTPDDILVITSENRNQKIETAASSLICLESVGNYINAFYLEEGKIVRSMLRNTMKEIELQVQKAGDLFKCHRAFIINLRYVEKVKGNSQGYRLDMKYLDREIPVARNYSKSFREAIGRKA